MRGFATSNFVLRQGAIFTGGLHLECGITEGDLLNSLSYYWIPQLQLFSVSTKDADLLG